MKSVKTIEDLESADSEDSSEVLSPNTDGARKRCLNPKQSMIMLKQ